MRIDWILVHNRINNYNRVSRADTRNYHPQSFEILKHYSIGKSWSNQLRVSMAEKEIRWQETSRAHACVDMRETNACRLPRSFFTHGSPVR